MTALFLATLLSAAPATSHDIDEGPAQAAVARPLSPQDRILHALRVPWAGFVAVLPCAVIVAEGGSWPLKVALGVAAAVVVLAVVAGILGAGAWYVGRHGLPQPPQKRQQDSCGCR